MRGAQAIPNLLTGLRLALLPVFLLLLTREPAGGPSAWPIPPERLWAALVLSIMGVTDALDGWAARRLGAISRIGSLADAVADRLVLVVPLLVVALTAPTGLPHVPLWMPLWLVVLDVLGSSAWLVAWRRYDADIPVQHNMAGRVATWVLFGLLFWIAVGLPAGGVIGIGLLGLGLATMSSFTYVRRWLGAIDLDGRSPAD